MLHQLGKYLPQDINIMIHKGGKMINLVSLRVRVSVFQKIPLGLPKKKKKKSTAALWFMCELSRSGSRLSTLGLQQVVQFEKAVAPLGGRVLPEG